MSEKYSDYSIDEKEVFLTKEEPLESVPKRRHSRFLGVKFWALIGSAYLFTAAVVNNSTFDYGFRSQSTSTSEGGPFSAYLQALDINLAGKWSKIYTAEAHLAGTNYGLVEFTQRKFEEYGFETEIDTYDILVSYPLEHDLKLYSESKNGTIDVVYQPTLKEDVLKEDETSGGDGLVPTFLGYAANGNVTGEYVYVNYGSIEDFNKLEKLGVDISGKIVVARYGGIFRGLKVKFAQDRGAIGVLIYTDPGDDYGITPANGYKQYPNGPARQELAVQRGSVQFLGGEGAAPGDPTTPGYASKPGAERQDPHASIGKIPVLPISYREVKPILAKLNGHGASSKQASKGEGKPWVGELEGFDYSTGPNPNFKLNLYNEQNFTITPLWNVYGEIKGEIEDEAILIGNHRDAWIKGGAGDPNSGSAVLIEIARGLGALKAAGYKFKRSIVLASWDGEEYGLLGSTEFGEFAAARLQKNFIAYFNVDVAATGKNLSLEASPTLNHILKKTLKSIEHPSDGKSLFEHFENDHKGLIRNLGSGSDYTVFLEHLGIPSVDMGFTGGKGSPVYHYHSNYDSYHWMEKYGDPGFVYHNTLAKYLGLAVLELNEHEVIEFKLTDVSHDLLIYFNQTVDTIPESWFLKPIEGEAIWNDYLSNTEEELSYIDQVTSGYYTPTNRFTIMSPFPEYMKLGQCPHHKTMQMYGPEYHKEATLKDIIHTTFKDLHSLHNISSIFDEQSYFLQTEYENLEDLHWWQKIRLYFQIKRHNKSLQYYERNFLHHKGLDTREWFKHVIFASGRFTGYAGQTFPGLREAIEDEKFERLVHWLGVISRTIRRASGHISIH